MELRLVSSGTWIRYRNRKPNREARKFSKGRALSVEVVVVVVEWSVACKRVDISIWPGYLIKIIPGQCAEPSADNSRNFDRVAPTDCGSCLWDGDKSLPELRFVVS